MCTYILCMSVRILSTQCVQKEHSKKRFLWEETKGVIIMRKSKKDTNTISMWKKSKEQITIYKTLHRNYAFSNMNPTTNMVLTRVLRTCRYYLCPCLSFTYIDHSFFTKDIYWMTRTDKCYSVVFIWLIITMYFRIAIVITTVCF